MLAYTDEETEKNIRNKGQSGTNKHDVTCIMKGSNSLGKINTHSQSLNCIKKIDNSGKIAAMM